MWWVGEILSRARLDPIASNTRQSKQTLAQVILAVGRYESITLLPGKESRTGGQCSNSARYFLNLKQVEDLEPYGRTLKQSFSGFNK